MNIKSIRLIFGATLLVMFGGCADTLKKSELANQDKDYFDGAQGCFLLYNVKSKQLTKVIGEETCRNIGVGVLGSLGGENRQ